VLQLVCERRAALCAHLIVSARRERARKHGARRGEGWQ
jgi:hypothetical protein